MLLAEPLGPPTIADMPMRAKIDLPTPHLIRTSHKGIIQTNEGHRKLASSSDDRVAICHAISLVTCRRGRRLGIVSAKSLSKILAGEGPLDVLLRHSESGGTALSTPPSSTEAPIWRFRVL
jgi:hypothetical protein